MQRIEGLLPELLQRYGSDVSSPQRLWNGNVMAFSFVARWFTIKGTVTVGEAEVVLDADIPPLLFEASINQAFDTLFGKDAL